MVALARMWSDSAAEIDGSSWSEKWKVYGRRYDTGTTRRSWCSIGGQEVCRCYGIDRWRGGPWWGWISLIAGLQLEAQLVRWRGWLGRQRIGFLAFGRCTGGLLRLWGLGEPGHLYICKRRNRLGWSVEGGSRISQRTRMSDL